MFVSQCDHADSSVPWSYWSSTISGCQFIAIARRIRNGYDQENCDQSV